jgi:hypothetical protein
MLIIERFQPWQDCGQEGRVRQNSKLQIVLRRPENQITVLATSDEQLPLNLVPVAETKQRSKICKRTYKEYTSMYVINNLSILCCI